MTAVAAATDPLLARRVTQLFRGGCDTREIAGRLGLDEAPVARLRDESRVDWDAHEATLRRMWADDATAGAIAAAIPNATRNAVLGKLHRLGMPPKGRGPGPRPKPRGDGAIETAASTGTAAPIAAAAKQMAAPVRRERTVSKAAPAPRVASPAPAPVPKVTPRERELCFVAPADRPGLDLADLEVRCCRWPYDGVDGEPVRYCGAATDDVYCKAHARLAYQPGKTRGG